MDNGPATELKQPVALAEEPKVEKTEAGTAPTGTELTTTERAITERATTTERAARPKRAAVAQNLNKLRGLIPVVSGALRMVDHGAVQALARLLPLLEGAPQGAPSHAGEAMAEELGQGMLELQKDTRELRMQLHGHTVQTKRLEEQIERIRESTDRDRAALLALSDEVQSLSKAMKGFGAVLVVLLVLVVAGVGFLLFHLSSH
ncbi:hypothetical protein [Acidipila rosea]|uniref:Uncharacterized protein n=1 Tax=Acidipila rosea TaxID=768535 RepID=A0A4R1L7I4_9BACT|nr:hypothetical protein [Acidipila rosea]TCK74186.1 hypothetical protein C7378_1808 [Acidipila rosea]